MDQEQKDYLNKLSQHLVVAQVLGNIGDTLDKMEKVILDSKNFLEENREKAPSPTNFKLMYRLLELSMEWIETHRQIVQIADMMMEAPGDSGSETVQ